MVHFYDVSREIENGMIVFPGNPSPRIERYATIPQNPTNESIIMMGSHTGSHVDAKLHIQNDAVSSLSIPLRTCFGKCKVFDLTDVESEIRRERLLKYSIQPDDIILLKTKNSQYNQFTYDYVHLKMDAAEYLVNCRVKTLGFDYLTVKKYGGDDDVHSLLINNLTLFEGLDLSVVREDEYFFVGFPIRINCDGSPARVVLVKDFNV